MMISSPVNDTDQTKQTNKKAFILKESCSSKQKYLQQDTLILRWFCLET